MKKGLLRILAATGVVALLVAISLSVWPGKISVPSSQPAGRLAKDLRPAPAHVVSAQAGHTCSLGHDHSQEHKPGQVANTAPDVERAREVVAHFDTWLASFQSGVASAEGANLARNRREAMKTLIRLDPEAALKAAVPRSVRAALPAEVQEELERFVDGTGNFSVVAVCDGGNELRRSATVQGERFTVYTFGSRLTALSKHGMAIHGVALDGELALSPLPYRTLEAQELAGETAPLTVASGNTRLAFSSQVELSSFVSQVTLAEASIGPSALGEGVSLPTASAAWITGTKKVLWMLADFSDSPGAPTDATAINSAMTQVNSYYDSVSQGTTSFTTTILPITVRCSRTMAYLNGVTAGEDIVSADCITAAKAYDLSHGNTGLYNPDTYDRWVVIFPELTGADYPWAGLATVGDIGLWLNGTSNWQVLAHELGHNQGLGHSRAWVSNATSPISIGSGTYIEYGDPFDLMGSLYTLGGHFNAFQKAALGYLSSSNGSVATVTTSGTYRLYRMDHRNASGRRAIRVSPGGDANYWLEYRRDTSVIGLGQESSVGSRLQNGVVIHWGNLPGYSNAGPFSLDMTPGSRADVNLGGTLESYPDRSDSPLGLSQSFVDAGNGLTITPVAVGGTSPTEYIDVLITFGATGSNNNPTLSAQVVTASPVARSLVTVSATASDPDGDTVYYRWDFDDGQPAQYTATATPRWLAGGAHTATCTVTDGKGGIATQVLNLTVSDPLTTWTRRATGLSTSVNMTGVTYGAAGFVACRYENQANIVTSPDGITWTLRNSYPNSYLNAVAYGNGRYIAVGADYVSGSIWGHAILTSTDGVSWTRVYHTDTEGELYAVTWTGSMFVAVGKGGRIVYSTTGTSWTVATSGTTKDLYSVAYGNGKYIAGGDKGAAENYKGILLSSTDASVWTTVSPVTDSEINWVSAATYFSGKLWIGGWYTLASSSDAVTWTSSSAASLEFWNCLRPGYGGLLFNPTDDGVLRFSEDGSYWSSINLSSVAGTVDFVDMAEGDGIRVIVGKSGVILQNGTATVATPVIAPSGGTYVGNTSVTITTTTSGATIYYTTDGSTPTTSSTLYTGAFTLSSTATVKAIAVRAGYSNSAVGSASFTITPKVATPTISPSAGSYNGSVAVSITTATSGATIYYTTDGSTPTTSSSLYTGLFALTNSATIKALAVKASFLDSDVASITYTVVPNAATPVFSPSAGTYNGSVSVSLSSATAGAAIHYTTDGSTPTTSSTLYSSAFTLSSTATVKAIAVKASYNNSSVASATYTVLPYAASPNMSPGSGTYKGFAQVELSSSTSGAAIRYTLDGTTPTASSTLYSGALVITENKTLKAIALKDGYANSAVAVAEYVITASNSRIVNMSVRAVTRSTATPLIMGFVAKGGSKSLLMRAAGPTLGKFGVAGIAEDPVLDLHDDIANGGAVIANNDNWGTNNVTTMLNVFASTGAFVFSEHPLDPVPVPWTTSLDAALVTNVTGLRTLYGYDSQNRSGVVLMELYDADKTALPRLVNVSARNYVGTGDDIMVMGFSIEGTENKRLLVRGVGPTLTTLFGLQNMVTDPKLKLYRIIDGVPSLISENDDWGTPSATALQAAFTQTGAFSWPDTASKDAAMILDLAPGLYSVELHSVTGLAGDAMIELYEME